MSSSMREEMCNRVFVHLRDTLGLPDDICVNLVKTAGENIRQAYDDALAALAAADYPEAARVGHRMKGNMLNAGLSEGAALALDFERAVGARVEGGDGQVKPEEAEASLERMGKLLFS